MLKLHRKTPLFRRVFLLLSRAVTHVFNSWEAMPSTSEQMAMPGSRTNPALVTAHFLLKPGRRYEEAVKKFQPYDKIQEVNAEARKAPIQEGTRRFRSEDIHLREQSSGRKCLGDD
jgi:hypothetical protein